MVDVVGHTRSVVSSQGVCPYTCAAQARGGNATSASSYCHTPRQPSEPSGEASAMPSISDISPPSSPGTTSWAPLSPLSGEHPQHSTCRHATDAQMSGRTPPQHCLSTPAARNWPARPASASSNPASSARGSVASAQLASILGRAVVAAGRGDVNGIMFYTVYSSFIRRSIINVLGVRTRSDPLSLFASSPRVPLAAGFGTGCHYVSHRVPPILGEFSCKKQPTVLARWDRCGSQRFLRTLEPSRPPRTTSFCSWSTVRPAPPPPRERLRRPDRQ